MKRDTAAASLRKKALTPRRPSPGQNSSSVKSPDARSRAWPQAREFDHIAQRYADLYDFAPTGYVSFDRSGRIAEINLTATQLFGLTRQHLIGMPFSVFVFRDDLPLFLKHLLCCRSSETHVETELRLKDAKRKIIPVQLCSTPINASPHNGALLFQTSIVDLTDRKRAEDNLRESEKRLRAFLENSATVAWLKDESGRNLYLSENYRQRFQLRPTDWENKTDFELWPKAIAEEFRKNDLAVLSEGGPLEVEEQAPNPDGTISWWLNHKFLICDKSGRRYVGGLGVDITERKRTEQQLRVRDAVSSALAMAGSLKEAAVRIIQAVCGVGAWEAGALWGIDRKRARLYCVDFWHRSDLDASRFEAASRKRRFAKGIGLPGRVWRSAKPVWVRDVARDPNFPRAKLALKDRLHSGFCFPIKLGNRVLGVLECFSREIREPDKGLLQMFASVGSQIGQFIERKKNEDALAETARQQAALYEFGRRQQETKSLADIYGAGLEAIMAGLRCDRASILLFDEQQVMRFVAWHGLSEKYRRSVQRHSPWKPDTKNLQPVTVPDVDLACLPRPLKAAILGEEIRAAAFVPLIAGKKLIGKFMACHRVSHFFTDSELNLATMIARQLVQAIESARSEEALRKSEERHRGIVNQSLAGIAEMDLAGRFLSVNDPYCRITGYSRAELVGRLRMQDITHRDYAAQNVKLFEKCVKEGAPFEIEKEYVRKEGSRVDVLSSVSGVRDSTGKVQSVVAVSIDITGRKKAEAAVKKSKELLAVLVERRTRALRLANLELKSEIDRRKGLEGEILKVTDREQQRLGRELHDGLCQQLTGIGLMAQTVAVRLKNHRVVDVEDLEKIAKLVSDSAMEARMIARDLHKEQIEAAGFEQALRALTERTIWNTPCKLRLQTKLEIDNDRVASETYRILREAITNANKHARATRVIVSAWRQRRDLAISVDDDGVGLNGKGLTSDGLGFHIMKYRARTIGARVKVESPRKGGTRVTIYLPAGSCFSGGDTSD